MNLNKNLPVFNGNMNLGYFKVVYGNVSRKKHLIFLANYNVCTHFGITLS